MKENIVPLNELLKEVEVKEKKSRKRFYYSLFLPAAIALILLTVFTYLLNDARNKKKELEETIVSLSQEISDKNSVLTKLKEENELLITVQTEIESKFKQNLNWKESDVLGSNDAKIQDSKSAVEKIKNLFKTRGKNIDLDMIVRYFIKIADKESVKNTLTKSGLRNLFIFPNDYNSQIPTNKISIGEKTTLSEVKLIACAMIWAGLEVKKIERYSSKRAKYLQESHSVEISGEDGLDAAESINLEKIANAKTFDELISH